jgi:hypothetical protein
MDILSMSSEAEILEVCFIEFKKTTPSNTSGNPFPYRDLKAQILCVGLGSHT